MVLSSCDGGHPGEVTDRSNAAVNQIGCERANEDVLKDVLAAVSERLENVILNVVVLGIIAGM